MQLQHYGLPDIEAGRLVLFLEIFRRAAEEGLALAPLHGIEIPLARGDREDLPFEELLFKGVFHGKDAGRQTEGPCDGRERLPLLHAVVFRPTERKFHAFIVCAPS